MHTGVLKRQPDAYAFMRSGSSLVVDKGLLSLMPNGIGIKGKPEVDTSNCELILTEYSPNGRWKLTVYTTPESHYFRADMANTDHSVGCCSEVRGLSFGPYPHGSSSEISVRWDLPNNVLGIYVREACYLLFRCGAGRRRNRYQITFGLATFSAEHVEWFCAKHRAQFRRIDQDSK